MAGGMTPFRAATIVNTDGGLLDPDTLPIPEMPPVSDGNPPPLSPPPTLVPGVGSLFVKWDMVENADSVTYDVHMVEGAEEFDPDASNLIVSTTANLTSVRSLADATPLSADVDYAVRIVARDVDGAADPSPVASNRPSKITSPDIAAGAITADMLVANDALFDALQAQTIRGVDIEGATITGALVQSARTGARWVLSGPEAGGDVPGKLVAYPSASDDNPSIEPGGVVVQETEFSSLEGEILDVGVNIRSGVMRDLDPGGTRDASIMVASSRNQTDNTLATRVGIYADRIGVGAGNTQELEFFGQSINFRGPWRAGGIEGDQDEIVSLTTNGHLVSNVSDSLGPLFDLRSTGSIGYETGRLWASGDYSGWINVIRFGPIAFVFGVLNTTSGTAAWREIGITLDPGLRPTSTAYISGAAALGTDRTYRLEIQPSGLLRHRQSSPWDGNQDVSGVIRLA